MQAERDPLLQRQLLDGHAREFNCVCVRHVQALEVIPLEFQLPPKPRNLILQGVPLLAEGVDGGRVPLLQFQHLGPRVLLLSLQRLFQGLPTSLEVQQLLVKARVRQRERRDLQGRQNVGREEGIRETQAQAARVGALGHRLRAALLLVGHAMYAETRSSND
eukprot:scaffold91_cov254-Pinguiococcus_pyrenoidosus.AAC.12